VVSQNDQLINKRKNEIMQKHLKFYLGSDVSKLTLDISLMVVKDHKKGDIVTERFENNTEGLKALHKWLKMHKVSFDANSLLVIENTGIYHRLIWEYCSKHNLPIYIGNATHIKWSFGIARGKNDRIDSKRLCGYASKHADEIKATPVLNPVLLQLKDLMTARSRLLAQLGSIKVYLKELKLSNNQEVHKLMEQAHKAALDGLKKSLAAVEKQIHQIIASQPDIQANYKLLITVPGIGHLTAVYIICCTNNFISKITGKQLACYAGVVPFENTSGTSIKGKNKVHKMANKTLKKLLHLCALAAIKYYPEFKEYYDRKVIEGKNKLSVQNAVRNKIALRAAAVINNQQPYVDNYKKAA
jgi:transposase